MRDMERSIVMNRFSKLSEIREKYERLSKKQSVFESDLKKAKEGVKGKYDIDSVSEAKSRVKQLRGKFATLEEKRNILKDKLTSMISKMEGR